MSAKARIIDFYAFDMSTRSKVTNVRNGQLIGFKVPTKNVGDADGILFIQIINLTDEVMLGKQNVPFHSGESIEVEFDNYTMPNHSIQLKAEAGHYE